MEEVDTMVEDIEYYKNESVYKIKIYSSGK